MRILYLHQYFKTPEDGEAMRSYYIAKAMVSAGHHVVMISSHNKPHFEKKIIEGIEINYLPISYSNEYNFTRRIKAFIKFQKKCVPLAKSLGPFDLCYATSTPLTVGSAALKLKKLTGTPYVFEVRDLWPDAPIQLGAVNNKLVANALKKLERNIYQNANCIVALNPQAKSIIESRTSTPVELVPNMSDIEFYRPKFSENEYPVLLYAGTIGRANDVTQAIELAKTYPEARFIIAGEGRELATLKAMVEGSSIKNVLFLGKVSKDELRRLYEKSDFALITFAPYKVLELNSPNKFFDALANGVLPIVSIGGWIKELVEENKCGIYANPESPEATTLKLRALFADKQALNVQKQNARNLAEKEFSTVALLSKLLRVVENSVQLQRKN